MKLTASKMSRAALATADSGKRSPREGRGDSALVGCTFVGVGRVGVRRVGVGRVGVGRVGCAMIGAGRVGVSVSTGKGTGSCKSGEGESRDDLELHVVVFFCCNTEH